MPALGDYTSTEAIRGCLGLDASDLPDAYLVDSKVDLELTLDLDGWLPSHASLYAAGTAGGATAAAKAIADRIKLYAQWFGAYEMARRPLAFPQIVTDGKAQFDRFKVDLERLAALAAEKMAQHKGKLDELVNQAVVSTGLPTSLVSVAVPGSDPITEGLQ